MFIRTVKVPSSSGAVNEYVRVVESYRDAGKVKQRVVSDLGRKDVLTAMLPKLQRVLLGTPTPNGEDAEAIEVVDASTWGPMLAVRALFDEWKRSGRVQVDHGQLGAWYRTLDVLIKAKDKIEVALFHRLRDLFSLKPELVLFDITSTYFEGAGPEEFAKHGYSRDGKPQNVQVVVGVVMVAGWPIAHHVWPGNRLDVTTVREVLADLRSRFEFQRVVFVGDRGMVSEENLEAIEEDGHGYLVGLKRRRNAELDAWLQKVDETKWLDCPVGITARERKENPPRTRVQEIATDEPMRRVFVIDSDERRAYEQAKRSQAMERTRVKLESVQRRVAEGKLTEAARIGAAAERALRDHRGHRCYAWSYQGGVFSFREDPVHFEREKRLEGRYVISTSEKTLTCLDAVALYKQLMEVERGFRRMKDVLSLRPVYHQSEPRVKAHVFVAALGLLLQTLLQRRLDEAGVDLSAEQALQALETVRHVSFRVDDGNRAGISASNPRARQVLRALGVQDYRPPIPPTGEETVM